MSDERPRDRRDPRQPDRRHLLQNARLRGGRRASDPPSECEWLSVNDFASKYGIGTDTVHKWIRSDHLLIYRMVKLIRVRDLQPDEHERLRKLVDDQTVLDRNQPKVADGVK